jgi:hypothetical protein
MHFELKKETHKQLEVTSMQINNLNKRLFSFKFINNSELTKINVNINKNLSLLLLLITLFMKRIFYSCVIFTNRNCSKQNEPNEIV